MILGSSRISRHVDTNFSRVSRVKKKNQKKSKKFRHLPPQLGSAEVTHGPAARAQATRVGTTSAMPRLARERSWPPRCHTPPASLAPWQEAPEDAKELATESLGRQGACHRRQC